LLCYFMGCIALVRCVLMLRCGLAGVEWYPYAGKKLGCGGTRMQAEALVVSLYSTIKMMHGLINVRFFLIHSAKHNTYIARI